mmetsp:Transcript_19732/g.22058  ORF Transcript_19732/g.22058 Transcript_19732/m.22058 type:complete len:116 (-) Transcript_19732:30-377(-)
MRCTFLKTFLVEEIKREAKSLINKIKSFIENPKYKENFFHVVKTGKPRKIEGYADIYKKKLNSHSNKKYARSSKKSKKRFLNDISKISAKIGIPVNSSSAYKYLDKAKKAFLNYL